MHTVVVKPSLSGFNVTAVAAVVYLQCVSSWPITTQQWYLYKVLQPYADIKSRDVTVCVAHSDIYSWLNPITFKSMPSR